MRCADPYPTGTMIDGCHRCKCGRVIVLHCFVGCISRSGSARNSKRAACYAELMNRARIYQAARASGEGPITAARIAMDAFPLLRPSPLGTPLGHRLRLFTLPPSLGLDHEVQPCLV